MLRVLGTFSTKNQANLMHGWEVRKSVISAYLTTLATLPSFNIHAHELKLGRHVPLLIPNRIQFRNIFWFVQNGVWQPLKVSFECCGTEVPQAEHEFKPPQDQVHPSYMVHPCSIWVVLPSTLTYHNAIDSIRLCGNFTRQHVFCDDCIKSIWHK